VRVSTAPPESAASPIGPLVADWYRRHARALPWRASGFGAWGILVSEFMLQQTPVARVIEPLAAWLERWPTPAALASVPAGEAVRAWGRLGYPRRALRLHACAVAIAERHGGVVPDDVDELLALPGVGEYTARAVAVFAYGRRHPVVDTNVRRVLARAVLGQAEPAPPSVRRDLAEMEAILPEDAAPAQVVSAAVMELGAVVCTARSPRCDDCPLAGQCAWRAAGYPVYLGPRQVGQARYEGSDRQVRGLLLAELRASEVPVSRADLDALWPDAAQRDRALAGLVADGLAVGTSSDGYSLPD
jgi:A/G-specific adenine glycosylase